MNEHTDEDDSNKHVSLASRIKKEMGEIGMRFFGCFGMTEQTGETTKKGGVVEIRYEKVGTTAQRSKAPEHEAQGSLTD